MDECCLPVPCSCDCAQPMPTHWIAEWTDDEGQRWRQRLGAKLDGKTADNGPIVPVWVE